MGPKVLYGPPDLDELRKTHFVVDTHFHTKYSHDCNTPVPDILDRAERLGIHVAITDHNKINGVLEAYSLEKGQRLVIPGIEITTKEGKDVIALFYDVHDLVRFYESKVAIHIKKKNSLRSDTTKYSIHQLLPDLQAERCVVMLPHPVGSKNRACFHYFQKQENRYLLKYVHVIEAINETMTHKSNLTSLGWSVQLGKPVTAGSDGHILRRLGEAITAAQVSDMAGFLDAVKSGHTVINGREMRLSERIGAAYVILKEKVRKAGRRLQ